MKHFERLELLERFELFLLSVGSRLKGSGTMNALPS